MSSRILIFNNLDNKLTRLDKAPIIVNSLPLETEEDRKYLESLCLTRYGGADVLATVPMCGCRNGRYIGAKDLGIICDVCNTEVVSHHSQSMESDIWISVPHGIDYFLAPLAWIFIEAKLKSKTFSGLAWAMDPSMPEPDITNRKGTDIVKRFKRQNYKRGLRYLKEELDKLLEITYISTSVAIKREELREFMQQKRDDILVKHIPIPTKVAFAVESTSYGNYYDETMNSMMEAIYASAGTSNEKDVRKLESRFTKVMSDICKYLPEVINGRLSQKTGWFRRVNSGSRMFFSYRDIATSNHGWHRYTDTMIPYHQLLAMMEPFVIGKLIDDHNWCDAEAKRYTLAHATDNDPFLWEILEDFIDETEPYVKTCADTVVVKTPTGVKLRKLPSTLKTRERKGQGIVSPITRYPSLSRGSTTAYRIVGLTKSEISISPITLVSSNLDFDGDMLTGTICLDLFSSDACKLLEPHYDIHSTTNPTTLKNNMAIPSTICSQISNWMASEVMVIS